MLTTILAFIAGATFAGITAFILYRMKLQNFRLQNEFTLHNLDQMKQQQVDLQHKMTQQFENMANRIFEDKSSKFVSQNMQNLSSVLDPLKERLKDFTKKVEDTYGHERAERGALRGELSKLMDLNRLMSNEAANLTRALKGEVKTQGNWGELILENILERSGLRKGQEYTVQGIDMDLRGEDNEVQRPDVIVNLPDGKHLVVDSKMTLNAYEAYSSATTTEEQDRQGRLHVEALKKHIDGLSSKKYYANEKLISPDFVILFMPLEPAFALAFKVKPEIFQTSWDKQVAVVSPTTLLTTLRTVASLWKQDRQQKNAVDIAKKGGLLYDKFVGLVKDIENLGFKLDDAQKAHNGVMNKLSIGKGNLIRQVEELKLMGAKTEKSLPVQDIESEPGEVPELIEALSEDLQTP
ncbi:MAG: DNA recombination protein RmuC, partial [Bdellovibrionaceae bacterium]|nr:DNA recombination protein RmuC [Pseudobdellovibrionaceae bacterium]